MTKQKQPRKQVIRLPRGTTNKSLNPKEQFPNPGIVTEQHEVKVHENNYFKNHQAEDIRKRYMQFSVFMEQLNNTLGLDRSATVEQFASRVHDLVMAAAKV